MTKGGQYLVVDGIASLCKTFVSKRVATWIFSLHLYGSYTTSRRIPSTVAVDSKSIYKTCHCAHHISVTDSILFTTTFVFEILVQKKSQIPYFARLKCLFQPFKPRKNNTKMKLLHPIAQKSRYSDTKHGNSYLLLFLFSCNLMISDVLMFI